MIVALVGSWMGAGSTRAQLAPQSVTGPGAGWHTRHRDEMQIYLLGQIQLFTRSAGVAAFRHRLPTYTPGMRIAFAMLGMSTIMSACSSASSDPGNLDDPEVRAKLRTLGLQSSSISGVPLPQTMTAVWSADHQVAEQIVSGDIVNDHVPVYVIEMTGGTFTALDSPTGNPFQGTVLTLTINAQTFEGTDGGITRTTVDLHLIDPHVVDLLD